MGSKISQLTEASNLSSGNDQVEIIINTEATPLNRRMKALNLLKRLFLGDGTQLTITTIADGEFLKRSGTNITSAVPPGAQRWTINFTANGDAYIAADVAMTIDAGVAAIGTGTLAYEKSTTAAPGTFSSTSLPATLQAGAWLKVTVSSIGTFKAVELKRTA